MPRQFEESKRVVAERAVFAMNAAADRLIATSPDQLDLAFAAVGETLWWVCTVDGLFAGHFGWGYRSLTQDGLNDTYTPRLFAGLRYARNRFTHDCDVLEYVRPGVAEQPQAFWQWTTVPSTETTGGRKGEEEYQTLVAGYPVRQVLTHALTFLRITNQGLA